jgi:hypothetical protein
VDAGRRLLPDPLVHVPVLRPVIIRRAFKFAGLPVDKHADPFAVVIRCTCDGKADNKTISKWSRALRYVVRVKKPRHQLTTFMKNRGGVNACAKRYAKYFGRGER